MTREEMMIEIAQRYAAGEGFQGLTREFGVSPSAIYAALKAASVPVRTRSEGRRKYTRNEAAFDVLTPEALYWLGFLATDGGITSNRGSGGGHDQIALKLALKDRDHVLAFRAFISSDAPLVDSKNVVKLKEYQWAMLRIPSQKLCSRLEELGITKRKTQTLEVSLDLATSPDFWRGALDGNGSIYVQNPESYRYWRVGFSAGSVKFAGQFAEFLTVRSLKFNHRRDGNVSVITISAQEATLKLLSELYERPGPVLARKGLTVTDALRELRQKGI